MFSCEVGDLVQVDYDRWSSLEFIAKWMGVCTWTDGYKYSFLVADGEEIIWTKNDLFIVGAEVIEK